MYRLTFEYGHQNAFPRYFDPAQARLSYAKTWDEALKNALRVVGKTHKANLDGEGDPCVIERRRNKKYIVTIRDMGQQ